MPRDRNSSFEPKIIARRGSGGSPATMRWRFPCPRGLTPRGIATRLADVYDAQVSKQTISTITDRVWKGRVPG